MDGRTDGAAGQSGAERGCLLCSRLISLGSVRPTVCSWIWRRDASTGIANAAQPARAVCLLLGCKASLIQLLAYPTQCMETSAPQRRVSRNPVRVLQHLTTKTHPIMLPPFQSVVPLVSAYNKGEAQRSAV